MRYSILFVLLNFFVLSGYAQDNTAAKETVKQEKAAEPKSTSEKEAAEKKAQTKKEKVLKKEEAAKKKAAEKKAKADKKEKAVKEETSQKKAKSSTEESAPKQEKTIDTPKSDSPKTAPKVKEEKNIKSESKPPKEKIPYRFMLNVHGGIGLMNYFGDIRDNPGTTVHRIGSLPGYNFGIGANVTNYLEVNINAMLAKMTWNQNMKDNLTPLNFEAKVFTVGANLVYNFKNFIKSPTGITPFVSIGASYSDYNIYSDLQTTIDDGSGNNVTYAYNYWTDDNLIHSTPEGTPVTEGGDQIISRDYEYETRLSEFPITAVTIPVGAGFDFNASRKFAVRLGAYYYFTSTDKIDNVKGTQKGFKGFAANDGFIYTSMSVFFRFDPFKKKAPKIDIAGPEYGDLGSIADEDSDGDGVPDLADRCAGTPKGLIVDDNGCPADDDRDGIPDYRDKELKTPAGRIVDPNGVAISYQEIYKTYGSDTASLLRKNVNQEWLFSQKNADSKYTVHVGTYTNYDIPTQIKMRLAKMEDLQEHKVNDTISVFTLGSFDNFEDAEKRQNELIESGIDEAFGVNEGAIPDVGVDLGVVGFDASNKQPQGATLDIETVDVLQYGVELREYRLRIQLDKLSKLIAQHGVEMKSTDGGLKIYTIGSFSTFAEADALRSQVTKLGVKNPEITAKFNNETIDIEAAKEKETELQETEDE